MLSAKDGLVEEGVSERILNTDSTLAAGNAGGKSNHRNGYSVLAATSKVNPAPVSDFDDKSGHRKELYGIDVSPDQILAGTNAVLKDVAIAKSADRCEIPAGVLDALRVKIVMNASLIRTKDFGDRRTRSYI